MGRRRRTLLNVPTGRTATAPPARERGDPPRPAADLTYSTPSETPVDVTEPEGTPKTVREDPPAIVREDPDGDDVPAPFEKQEAPPNPAPAPTPDGEKPVEPTPLERQTPQHHEPDPSLVPALVMVGVAGLVVIVVVLFALVL